MLLQNETQNDAFQNDTQNDAFQNDTQNEAKQNDTQQNDSEELFIGKVNDTEWNGQIQIENFHFPLFNTVEFYS